MEGDCNTDSLRSLATHWSLAGDDNLISILQNTHKKIVGKCQDVNTKLDEMVSALDDASVDLQNVNNKFMALSNRQFIESRVYDEDEVAAPELTPVKETPTQPQPSSSDMVRKSLSILESMHEVVTILRDSDTESDSDDENASRILLKPKDMYRERRLPYIIGSEAWKNKWRPEIIVPESDTDSSTSNREDHTPEYSETEDDEPLPLSKTDAAKYEKEDEVVRDETHREAEMTPSDMAAELARRLAGQAPQILEPEDEYLPPRPAVKAVYKPQQPTTGVIFSDEPPPLEGYDSDSGQDDIFAELHTSQPYSKKDNGFGRSVADDLFGGRNDSSGEGIFSDTVPKVSEDNIVTKILSVTNNREPRLPEKLSSAVKVIDKGPRKPVGGISVFGSSKGADSIGAAVLKRNNRKESTSEVESDAAEQVTPPRTNYTDQLDCVNKEKDILNDLFAKPKHDNKRSKGTIKEKVTESLKEEKIEESVKVDLFSDNIFDDIDDIFSSNIVKIPKPDSKVSKQSIFDDNDVDLFADVIPSKLAEKPVSRDKRGIFDSDDDDLFGGKSLQVDTELGKAESQINISSGHIVDSKKVENIRNDLFTAPSSSDVVTKETNSKIETKYFSDPTQNVDKIIKESKSIFDSDSDSDIFENLSTVKLKTDESPQPVEPLKLKSNTAISKTDDRLTEDVTPKVDSPVNTENIAKTETQSKGFKIPSLFDKEIDNDFYSNNDNGILNVNKKVRNNEISSKKTDTALKEAETNTFKKLPQDTTVIISESLGNGSSENLENQPEQYIREGVLKTTTVILDKRNVDKVSNHNTAPEVLQENIESTNADIEREVLLTDEFNPIPNKDVFGDIRSEPPEFEKPTEPKKSKNVNALFDDDSDDETLFFKRSDGVDEDQEIVSPSVIPDALFGIFHNEPPAIDVDFVATDNTNPDIYAATGESLLSKPVLSKITIPETPSSTFAKSDDLTAGTDIFSSIDSENIFTPIKDFEIPTDIDNTRMRKDCDKISTDSDKSLNPGSTEEEHITETTSPVDKDPLEVIREKVTDMVQENWNEDSSTNKESEPSGFFKTLNISSKSNQNTSPVVPDFEDPDKELFKPSKIISASSYTFSSSHQPRSSFLYSVEDPDSTMGNHSKLDDRKDKNDKPVSIYYRQNRIQQHITTDSNNDDINKGKSKVFMENKLETGENLDVKKIGKLKNVKFNIDVATLLPGASPKKQSKLQSSTTKVTDEDLITENEGNESKNTRPGMIKSISFEGEPNSDVLDNKVSKDRAKIQVKRRPSTRKARREAVRKSAIDLEDSTVISNSINHIENQSNNHNTKLEMEDEVRSTDLPQTIEKSSDLQQKLKTPKVTKIVYILNDSDIFDNEAELKDEISSELSKNIDNIISPSKKSNLDSADGINTLGRVYKSTPISKPGTSKAYINEFNESKVSKSTLFDDASDEELFSENKKIVQKSSIFSSDSEEDLFTGKKKEAEKKIEVKSSLFGEEDDSLFAVRDKTTDTKANIHKPGKSRDTAKSSEPVFDDPLSLLEDDE